MIFILTFLFNGFFILGLFLKVGVPLKKELPNKCSPAMGKAAEAELAMLALFKIDDEINSAVQKLKLVGILKVLRIVGLLAAIMMIANLATISQGI